MAEFALPQAIQIDNTPNQMLLKIADDARQQNMMQMKLHQENRSLIWKTMQDVNTEVSSDKYANEVKAANIAGLKTKLSEYLKSTGLNADPTVLQSIVSDNLTNWSKWTAAVNQVKAQNKAFVDSLPADSKINKATLLLAANNAALMQDGQPITDFDKIDLSKNHAQVLASANPENFIDMEAAGKDYHKTLEDFPTQVIEEKTKNQKGRMINSTELAATLPNYMQLGADANGKPIAIPKIDASGYMSEQYYNSIAPKGSNNDILLTSRAKLLMAHHNDDAKTKMSFGVTDVPLHDESDMGNIELLKRAIATQDAKTMYKGTVKSDKENLQKPEPVIIQTGGYTPPAEPEFTAPVDRLHAITKLDGRFLGKKGSSQNGHVTYDITDQFKDLPLFKNILTDEFYGPKEVQYNVGGSGQEPTILVKEKDKKPFKRYTVQQFTDLLVPKTDGTGYDPKAKPGKGTNRTQ